MNHESDGRLGACMTLRSRGLLSLFATLSTFAALSSPRLCLAQEEPTQDTTEQATVAEQDPASTQKTETPGKVITWESLPKEKDGFVELLKQQKFGDPNSLWRVADKHYFDGHGEVTLADQSVTLTKGSRGTGIVAKFEVPRNNYEIEFEARRTEGSDFFCGLTFPFDKQQATLILGGWGGSTVGISNINRFSAIENSTSASVQFVPDQWYKFRFRVTDDSVDLFMVAPQEQKEKRLFWLDPIDCKFETWWEQRPMEPLGFASWSSTGEIRKLRMRLVQSPTHKQSDQ